MSDQLLCRMEVRTFQMQQGWCREDITFDIVVPHLKDPYGLYAVFSYLPSFAFYERCVQLVKTLVLCSSTSEGHCTYPNQAWAASGHFEK